MKKYAFAFLFLFFTFPLLLSGQDDTIQWPKLYSWYVDSLGQTIAQPVDTSLFTSHDFNPNLGNVHLGHLGSPMHHNRLFERRKTPFLFSQPYQNYLKHNNKTRYFRIKTPYTFLKYITGGQKDTESRLWVKHSQNINKALNLGLNVNMIGSKKFYEDERSLKGRFLNFFGSYEKSHYSLYGNLNVNKVSNLETGGIQNREDFEVVEQRYIPGNLKNAQNVIKDNSLNIIQTLSLKKTSLAGLNVFKKLGKRETFQKTRESGLTDTLSKVSDTLDSQVPRPNTDTLQTEAMSDSVKSEKDVTRFYLYHRFNYSNNKKEYDDENPLSEFYSGFPVYIDSVKTRDKASQKSIGNKLKLVYSNDFLNLFAGVDYTFRKYSYLYPYPIFDESKNYDKFVTRSYNNLSVSAGWNFHTDSVFRLWARGKYYLSGFNREDFSLEGGIGTTIGRNILTIAGNYRYNEPDYFYQYYHSNHFRWDHEFSKISRLQIDARFHIPAIKTEFSIKPAVIHRYTYLDTSSVPVQYHENLNLTSVSLTKRFQFWRFYSTNDLVFQYTDRYDILGIPKFYLYHRFAFRYKIHFNVTDGDLYTQIGWSLYYYPSYYADDYMPALGLYHRQQSEKIGDKPIFNVFVNFRVKRMVIFGKLYHLNSYIQKRNYYTAPRYPMSPMMIKFGLSWSFYD